VPATDDAAAKPVSMRTDRRNLREVFIVDVM